MNRTLSMSIILLGVCIGAPSAVAQTATLTYQGQLANAARQAVNASYPMAFKLYVARDEAEAIWTEAYESVDVVDGVFTVDLGSNTPFPLGVGRYEQLYMGVSVNGSPEMLPRMKVSSALRAQWAKTAEHATDVRGEDVHPASVAIGDQLVINEQGQWVGDPTGLRGPEGVAGPVGPPGPEGINGASGDPGTEGPMGAQGPRGDVGPQGERGAPGAVGPQGDRGARGEAGTPGAVGSQGERGPRGESGMPGAVGPQGDLGARGEVGTPGVIGPQGERGPRGEAGTEGPMGAQGPRGLQGRDAQVQDDADGDGVADWLEGLSGTDPNDRADVPADVDQDGVPDVLRGAAGPPGPPGEGGPQGEPGAVGSQGARGVEGAPGRDAQVEDDRDGDGVADWLEVLAGSNPTDNADVPTDVNGDGVPDLLRGPVGAPGPVGPEGPAGAVGQEGPVGPVGQEGPVGPVGPEGPAGPVGPEGPVGEAGRAGRDGLAADLACAHGTLVEYSNGVWVCSGHAADPNAHHPADGAGVAMRPSSVTIGDTQLVDGSIDLGPEADDALTAQMVQTLVSGGQADQLHTHAAQAGGGGGVCYTAWGTNECSEGFQRAYSGTAITSAVFESTYIYPVAGQTLCSTQAPNYSNGRNRVVFMNGSQRREASLSCAVCCK